MKSCNKYCVLIWRLGNTVRVDVALLLHKWRWVTNEQISAAWHSASSRADAFFHNSARRPWLPSFSWGFHVAWKFARWEFSTWGVTRDQAKSPNVDGCQVVPARGAAYCGRESVLCLWQMLREGSGQQWCSEWTASVQRLPAFREVFRQWPASYGHPICAPSARSSPLGLPWTPFSSFLLCPSSYPMLCFCSWERWRRNPFLS